MSRMPLARLVYFRSTSINFDQLRLTRNVYSARFHDILYLVTFHDLWLYLVTFHKTFHDKSWKDSIWFREADHKLQGPFPTFSTWLLCTVPARPRQSSTKVEHTLVRICMEKEGSFRFEAWSMDSNKKGVFLKENQHGISITMFSIW